MILRYLRLLTAGLFLAATAPFMTSCRTATEPITGRKQIFLTAPGQETRMGLQAWRDILEDEKPTPDKAKAEAVRRVGNNLKKVVSRPEYEWEFRTFAAKEPNAFCLPGGKVGVYDALFKYVDNDAELAAVVGHEIGHAVARHGGERMTQAILQNLGALGLSAALKDESAKTRARWMAAYTGITTVGVILPYSRTHEYAADELGMIYMARAGYKPSAAVSFWEKFGKLGGAQLEFLSTHPLSEKRLTHLREILPCAMIEYETAPVQRGLSEAYEQKPR